MNTKVPAPVSGTVGMMRCHDHEFDKLHGKRVSVQVIMDANLKIGRLSWITQVGTV